MSVNHDIGLSSIQWRASNRQVRPLQWVNMLRRAGAPYGLYTGASRGNRNGSHKNKNPTSRHHFREVWER